MTKQKRAKKQIRPVETTSVLDKRFKRAIDGQKRIALPVHPNLVIVDLRCGSLASLDKYLLKEGGIPDRDVAIELHKLISGAAEDTRYRIVCVDHPNGTVNRGGRRPGKGLERVERDRRMVARYDQIIATEGKAYLARERVAKEFGCSTSTVVRAVGSDREQSKKLRSAAEAIADREAALAKLRDTEASSE